MKTIKIGHLVLDENSRPFIIAEAGVNHDNDLSLAKRMIDEATEGKADAIKFQTYKAEKIAASKSPAYWDATETQRDYFKKYDKFDEADYRELADYADKKGILFMSTPFDSQAADMLDELVEVFKVSSSDITNTPFLSHIARKDKPIILSTGASTIGEIENATIAIEGEGNNKLVLLHCVLSYPTTFEDANLKMIEHLAAVFPRYLIGYSDHTKPDKNMLTLTAAAMLGAKVIEKHFTYDKSLKGNDHYHAMDFKDLKTLNGNLDLLDKILGSEIKRPVTSELKARLYARRSIVADIDIPKGTLISENMLTFKRPSTGISPIYLEIVLQRTAKKPIKKDQILTWNDV